MKESSDSITQELLDSSDLITVRMMPGMACAPVILVNSKHVIFEGMSPDKVEELAAQIAQRKMNELGEQLNCNLGRAILKKESPKDEKI